MRSKAIGAGILLLAVALAWSVIATGLAHGQAWIEAIAGAERASADPALVEALFSVIIYAPMIVIALIAGAIERRNPLAPGGRPGAMAALGLLTGFGGMTVTVLYAALAGALVAGPAAAPGIGVLAFGLAVVALQASAEEIYFRGWLQPVLVARWGAPAGVLGGAVAFALLHLASGAVSPLSLINLLLGGLMFGLLALRGGGIAAAAGVHFAWNASEQLLYGLDPNPGVGGFSALFDHDLVGTALWGGSAEGLNGSIGTSFVLLAIITPLVVTSWQRLRLSASAAPATS